MSPCQKLLNGIEKVHDWNTNTAPSKDTKIFRVFILLERQIQRRRISDHGYHHWAKSHVIYTNNEKLTIESFWPFPVYSSNWIILNEQTNSKVSPTLNFKEEREVDTSSKHCCEKTTTFVGLAVFKIKICIKARTELVHNPNPWS